MDGDSGYTKPIFPNPANHKSTVWTYFGYHMDDANEALDKSHTVCRLCHCKIKYSGNTTNMTNHLRKRHFEVLTADGQLPGRSVSPPTQVRSRSITSPNSLRELGTTIKLEPRDDGDSSNHANPLEIVEECMNMMSNSQIHLSMGLESPGDKIEAVANFLIKGMMPISTISDPAFQRLVHAFDPSYSLPDENYFSKFILSIKYSIMRERAMDAVGKANRVCMKPEVWTHANGNTYLSTWASFIDHKWLYHTLVMETENITAKSINQELPQVIQNICQTWGIHSYIVTSEVLDDEWSSLFPLGSRDVIINCFGDTIQNSLTACFQMEETKKLLDKAWSMSHLINTNSLISDVLLEYQWGAQQGIELAECLPMSNPGRWQSTYDLLKNIKSMRQTISATSHDSRLSDFKAKFLNDDDVQECENLLMVLNPLKTAEQVLLEEDHALVSLILPLMSKLKTEISNLKELSPQTEKFVETLLKKLTDTEYLDGSKASQSLLVATLMDPRFKSMSFLEQIHQDLAYECATQQAATYYTSIRHQLNDEPPAKRVCTSDGDVSAIDQFLGGDQELTQGSNQEPSTLAAAELRRYLEEDNLALNSNPLKWWRRRASLYPLLSCLAKDALCSSATCTATQLLFNPSKQQTENCKRSRLEPSILHKMIFLNKNSDALKMPV